MANFLKRFRENFNLFVYDSKGKTLVYARLVNLVVSLLSVGVIIYYHGFPHTAERTAILITIIKVAFFIYLINFGIRLFYSLQRIAFLKRHWLESILMLVLVLNGISLYVLQLPILQRFVENFDVENRQTYYILMIQAYSLVLASFELLKYAQLLLNNLKMKPAILFLISFISLIGFGAGMLMLPEMTTQEGSAGFLDALFTSVSATCVTGLIVVDTATFFTTKGQFVIMTLIQLGGIGIISFASFFSFFLQSRAGIKQQMLMKDFLSEESLHDTQQLLRRIITYTLAIELVGAILIYALWDPSIAFESHSHKIFYSLFHSISAFCNAGFALFSDGLKDGALATSYVLHLAFALIIIFGSLGIPALRDLTEPKALRERLAKPWKRWKIGTTIVVYTTAALVIFGAITFFLIERNHILADQNTVEGVFTAIFQSVTTRTAGFNTVDIGALQPATIIMFIFLMFIGASSGSTGGGIKTSTFFLIFLAAYSTIRGKRRLEFQKKTISHDLLNKAYSIFIFSATFTLFAVFLLSITESGFSILALTFEAVSAVSTTGLSMGITAELSDAGQVILIACMYIGRVGTLTLAFALSSRVDTTSYKYPNAHMMVG